MEFIEMLKKREEGTDMDILQTCPWCGKKMELKIENRTRSHAVGLSYQPYYTNNAKVRYECTMCGSMSPCIYLDPELLDEKKVQEKINKISRKEDWGEDWEDEADD